MNDANTPYVVIGRYTYAFRDNFTSWMAYAAALAESDIARNTLSENLRCELVDNHSAMLQKFAVDSKALLHYNMQAEVEQEANAITELFRDPIHGGFYGTAVCAILENTSPVFIPELARMAKQVGCQDFTYTDVHGAADQKHASALEAALVAECAMVESHKLDQLLTEAADRTYALLQATWH